MDDLIIVGSGPAGVTASIYASRYKIAHTVLGDPYNSALAKAHLVENWPGEKAISGSDLLEKFIDHAKSLGGQFVLENLVSIQKNATQFSLTTSAGKVYYAKAVLVCSGTASRKLNIQGEREFLGRGVSYCAICDGAFFKNKKVAVVGGGNSAIMAALMLAEHAEKVYVIHRNSELSCEAISLERARKNSKIVIITNNSLVEIQGDKKVEKVVLNQDYEGGKELLLDGVFIEIGVTPNVVLLKDSGVETNHDGSVKIQADGSTNVAGLYAAGDVTSGSNQVRQILSAATEGMIAVTSIHKFLRQ